MEFGIRNQVRTVARAEFQVSNSEFQIPNSKFLIQLLLVILFAVSLVADDGQRAAASSTAADACALLTSAEVEAVLGGSVKERKPGGTQAAGALLTSQCVFGTSSARSVSLMVARANAAGGSTLTPREYWRQQFHSTGPEKAEKERDTRARPIAGVGEEAYWTGNGFAGALYVLCGDTFLRISVGGIRDEQARIATSKALALAAVKRFFAQLETDAFHGKGPTEARAPCKAARRAAL